jgi:RNA recognition motif-containing protein
VKKLYVGNLPSDTNEDDFRTLFAPYGQIRSLTLAKDLFSGRCKGFGFVEMEGHHARAAIQGLAGKTFRGSVLRVNEEIPRARRAR